MGLIGELLKLVFVYIPKAILSLILLPFKFIAWVLGMGGKSCPNCGSKKIRQLNTGQLQCSECHYTE